MICRVIILLFIAVFSISPRNSPATVLPNHDTLRYVQIYLKQGQLFLALREVDSVLENETLKKLHPHAYGLRGNILLRMKRFEEAENSLLKAYDLTEDSQQKATYANSLGVLYYETGNINRQNDYFNVAIKLAGSDPELLLRISLNQLHTQPEQVNRAMLDESLIEIANIESPVERARYYLNLAKIAKSGNQEIMQVAQLAQNNLNKAIEAKNDATYSYKKDSKPNLELVSALEIKLNQFRTRPKQVNGVTLDKLMKEVNYIKLPIERTKLYLILTDITKSGIQQISPVIQHALESAYAIRADIGDKHLLLEVIDSLADLYETLGKDQLALELSEQATALTDLVDEDDLIINIEWRKGKIYQRLGHDEYALAAFGRAVDHIQAIRRDIPVEYEDGKSSFRETLEPVYLGYVRLLLQKAGKQEGEAKQQSLLLARQTIEQIKQTELEDYLGGRCLIEGMVYHKLDSLDVKAAILYPIILPDRLELLVGIGKAIRHYTIPISEEHIRDAVNNISISFREDANRAKEHKLPTQSYRRPSESLNRWIIAPIENDLIEEGIKTLVVVPDGVLRLVPFAALFDGERFLVEKFAISISPGMSLLGDAKDNRKLSNYRTLLAGISSPGPVVEKYPEIWIDKYLAPVSNTNKQSGRSENRGIFNQRFSGLEIKGKQRNHQNTGSLLNDSAKLGDVRKELSLPGVEIELASLNEALENTTLLNERFTIDNFYKQVSGKSYDIIHIATHGFFSSDANRSFLMAYDDVLRLDDLKIFLKKDSDAQQSIQLLTFSACETAQGDDRAPLGFTGIALKANALSALGTLWPISDRIAPHLMTNFYKHIMQNFSKAESLQRAQLEVLKDHATRHPYYWSPFILVGNWL